MRLSDSDLNFVVQTVGSRPQDRDAMIELLRAKPNLLETTLENRKLTDRLVKEQGAFFQVSPYLLFSVLLRRVGRDLEGQSFVFEKDARGRSIPVFEALCVAEMLRELILREYLIEMLCSFV